jgi:TolA-binding protein
MKTRSSAMAEEQQTQVTQLQGQVTHLNEQLTTVQAQMVTRDDLHSELAKIQQMLQAMQAGQSGPNRARYTQRTQGGNATQTESGGGNSYQEGSSSNDGLKPKIVRWEFPHFDGEDPEMLCCRAEQFFDYYGTPDAQRLSICSFHMDGKAMVWF